MKSEARTLRAYAVLVFVFLYAPILALIAFSFNASRSQAVWRGFTWRWYSVALHNETILACIRNSLIVAAATYCAVAIGHAVTGSRVVTIGPAAGDGAK